MEPHPKVSVVIPAYNEEGNIRLLYVELNPILHKLTADHEIIFVDDGSTDNSFEIIRRIHMQDRRVRGLSLTRNFGHQAALLAGLEHAEGELIITMDCDLQHPPGIIPDMIKKAGQGFDVVNTLRTGSEKLPVLKGLTSKIFYKMMNVLSEERILAESSDFRLMTRRALDDFLRLRESSRFTRGLVGWLGYSQTLVGYQASRRHSGKSKYSFGRMLRYGIDGIVSFSARPLRIASYLGFIVFVAGLVYALYAILQHVRGETVTGWTSILVSVLLIGGIQLLMLGIMGEYIARIFRESKARPHYLVKEYTDRE